MPKTEKISSWIKSHPELQSDLDKVFCAACNKTISSNRKFLIDQHVKTPSHITKTQKFKLEGMVRTPTSQCANSSREPSQEEFNSDLCRALVASNIPLKKLNNCNLKEFLQKYCQMNIPDESTLRKKYLDLEYRETLCKIKTVIGTNPFSLSVDETTDAAGNYIAHLLIGPLYEKITTQSYLIASKKLDKIDNLTMTRFLQQELANFFLPDLVPSEKVLLLRSSPASYMIKAGQNLKIFYPNLIHVTCLAHSLNSVAEEIGSKFPLVNDLIRSVKQIFLKAPLRVEYYKETLPGVPLPPQLKTTRWGTWLEASFFYATYYDQLKNAICDMKDDNSAALIETQRLFNSEELLQDLTFIAVNYNFVTSSINALETKCLSLMTSVDLIKKFYDSCQAVEGNIGKEIFEKCKKVLNDNEGFLILQNAVNVAMGEAVESNLLTRETARYLTYASITTVDVEKSFSVYQYMYNDCRRSLLNDNFEKYLVIYSFLNILKDS